MSPMTGCAWFSVAYLVCSYSPLRHSKDITTISTERLTIQTENHEDSPGNGYLYYDVDSWTKLRSLFWNSREFVCNNGICTAVDIELETTQNKLPTTPPSPRITIKKVHYTDIITERDTVDLTTEDEDGIDVIHTRKSTTSTTFKRTTVMYTKYVTHYTTSGQFPSSPRFMDKLIPPTLKPTKELPSLNSILSSKATEMRTSIKTIISNFLDEVWELIGGIVGGFFSLGTVFCIMKLIYKKRHHLLQYLPCEINIPANISAAPIPLFNVTSQTLDLSADSREETIPKSLHHEEEEEDVSVREMGIQCTFDIEHCLVPKSSHTLTPTAPEPELTPTKDSAPPKVKEKKSKEPTRASSRIKRNKEACVVCEEETEF